MLKKSRNKHLKILIIVYTTAAARTPKLGWKLQDGKHNAQINKKQLSYTAN